jgi:2-deoxy-D-gluconate 3-dehydrogenase
MTIFDSRKRIAFVTGGNGGIGLGMAKGFASAAASVVIAGRNKIKAQLALSELRASGAQAEFVELDVLQEALLQTGDRSDRRAVWASRHSCQQRRHKRSQATAKPDRGRLASGDEHQSHRRLSMLAGSLFAYGPRWRRQDHQYRIDDVHLRSVLCHSLCGQQGWNRADDARLGDRMGKGQYSGQRHSSRIDTELTRKAREEVSGLYERVLAAQP